MFLPDQPIRPNTPSPVEQSFAPLIKYGNSLHDCSTDWIYLLEQVQQRTPRSAFLRTFRFSRDFPSCFLFSASGFGFEQFAINKIYC